MLSLISMALACTNELDRILDDPLLSGAIVSCTVLDDNGTEVYARNPALRVMPGSNQKLLSTCFALYKLGAETQPQTRIWKLKDKTIVDSAGDPMMTHERLQEAAATLRLNRRLAVYAREAYRPLIGPSWEWDDLPNKYAAPVTAFTVDRGSVEVWSEGEKLFVLPFNYGIAAARGNKTGAKKVIYDPIRRTLLVEGELPKEKTRLDTLAIDYPDLAAESLLGRPRGVIDQVPSTPPSLILTGPPVRDVIKECLVKSDNNLAENLLLMGAGRSTYAEATSVLADFLERTVKAPARDFRPDDGSGLSRHNVVTTRGLALLLQWALKQPTRDIWLDALAKPGVGTLADRLKGVAFVGKTGTLDMVVALSGYVHTGTGRNLTVSLILNHFVCSETEARGIADSFIKRLAQDGFGTDSAVILSHEDRVAESRHFAVDVHRDRGSRINGVVACERANR